MPGPHKDSRDSSEQSSPTITTRYRGLRRRLFHHQAHEASEEAKNRLIQADAIGAINTSPDIFDLVVISAFGGVVQQHMGSEPVLVHPFFMFLLSLPMLIGQTTALVYLNLDYDFEKGVHTASDRVELDKLLNILKLMMVMIVQLTMFTKILGSLRVLIFLLNPITWETVDRPFPCEMRMRLRNMFSPVFVAPPAVIAVLLHGILDYNICMDSVSIILYADSMKEAVYDSLAITFLADLGSQWWDVVSLIFHMEKLSHFQFRRCPDHVMERVKDTGLVRVPERIKHLWGVQRVGMTFPRVQVTVTAVIMLFIVTRQILVISQAMDTDIMPVSRDICSWYRFNKGEDEQSYVTKFLWLMTESWLIVSSPKEAINAAGEKYCSDKYDRLTFHDILGLPRRHPYRTMQLMCVMTVVILAQVWFQFNKEIREVLYENLTGEEFREGDEMVQDPEVLRVTQKKPDDEQSLLNNQAQQQDSDAEDLKRELHDLQSKLDARLAKERDEHQQAYQQAINDAESTRRKFEKSVTDLQDRLAAMESTKKPKRSFTPWS